MLGITKWMKWLKKKSKMVNLAKDEFEHWDISLTFVLASPASSSYLTVKNILFNLVYPGFAEFQSWDNEADLQDFHCIYPTVETQATWIIPLYVTRMDLSYLLSILQQPASQPDNTLFSIMKDLMVLRTLQDTKCIIMFSWSCARYK